MTKRVKPEELQKRDKIQRYFWKEVGAVEHISFPRLKDAIKREFKCRDDRLIQAQIDLMQTEKRIKIESRVKVWIKEPSKKQSTSEFSTYNSVNNFYSKEKNGGWCGRRDLNPGSQAWKACVLNQLDDDRQTLVS
jgi:hypothetical protein